MLKDWIDAARPKTLPAAVVPVMVGAAESQSMGFFEWWPVLVCLGFSLLVQIATNMANDYYDHIRGADTKDRVGPERLVASGKIQPRKMLVVSLVVFAVAFVVGLALVSYRGWELLAIGVISIVFGYGYTGGPFPLAYRGLGDVFVVLFFGLVATMGTVYVLSAQLTLPAAMLGLTLGLLANNILVVNNYRDLATDRRANKMTLIARWGRGFGAVQYRVQLLVAFGCVVLYSVYTDAKWAVVSLVLLPVGSMLSAKLSRTEGAALNGVLAKSAAVVLLTGIALTVGILVS